MSEIALSPILHVVVIGFHHKKGCQVEYVYPPFPQDGTPASPTSLTPVVPEKWRNLSALAIPDGSHNFKKDTIYFHLPALDDSCATVFGVSCYHQIDSKDVVNKSAEITRNSVQKSVCVLSSMPLYGLVSSRLDMITQAWFNEKDFADVSILEETYRQLCASCTSTELLNSQLYYGLSARDLVLLFQHNVLVLFKLLLLERRVLFFGQPVGPVSSCLLTLASLFPEMMESGLNECVCYGSQRLLSPTLKDVVLEEGDSATGRGEEGYLEVHYTDDTREGGTGDDWGNHQIRFTPEAPPTDNQAPPTDHQATPTEVHAPPHGKQAPPSPDHVLAQLPASVAPPSSLNAPPSSVVPPVVSGVTPTEFSASESSVMEEMLERDEDIVTDWTDNRRRALEIQSDDDLHRNGQEEGEETEGKEGEGSLPGIASDIAVACHKCQSSHCGLSSDHCGFPVAIFTKGVVCMPYLSLQYYNLLTDVNVRGFLIGASNMLFKQKRQLIDVIVEPATSRIDIRDESLRSLLQLTTGDLRFADYVVKQVESTTTKTDIYSETEWEGGDEWIRNQFKLYLASLMTTCLKGDDKLKEDFNLRYVHVFQATNTYKTWSATERLGLKEAPPGHPFLGHKGITDVKMRVSHALYNSEQGKRILAVADSTGKAASRTGKVIGGALTNVKGAVSSTVTSWFSSVRKWSSVDDATDEQHEN